MDEGETSGLDEPLIATEAGEGTRPTKRATVNCAPYIPSRTSAQVQIDDHNHRSRVLGAVARTEFRTEIRLAGVFAGALAVRLSVHCKPRIALRGLGRLQLCADGQIRR